MPQVAQTSIEEAVAEGLGLEREAGQPVAPLMREDHMSFPVPKSYQFDPSGPLLLGLP